MNVLVLSFLVAYVVLQERGTGVVKFCQLC
jgi:hypothetical protein